MVGPHWEANIVQYWISSEHLYYVHAYLNEGVKSKSQDTNNEPGRLGRFIKSSVLEDQRIFRFNVRDFERSTDPEDEHNVYAADLGPEWDDALTRHYRSALCSADKAVRVKELKNLGFWERRDSATDQESGSSVESDDSADEED